jgi:hypothetical protein
MLLKLSRDLLEVVFEFVGPGAIALPISKYVQGVNAKLWYRILRKLEKQRGKATLQERLQLDAVYGIDNAFNYKKEGACAPLREHYITGISHTMAMWLISAWTRIANQGAYEYGKLHGPMKKCCLRKRAVRRNLRINHHFSLHWRRTFLIYPFPVSQLDEIRHKCNMQTCTLQEVPGFNRLLNRAVKTPDKLFMFGIEHSCLPNIMGQVQFIQSPWTGTTSGQIDCLFADDTYTYEDEVAPEVVSGWCFRFERVPSSDYYHLRQCYSKHEVGLARFTKFRRFEKLTLKPIIEKLAARNAYV